MALKNRIDWKNIYNYPTIFHAYLTERGRGKSDTKGWQFLEIITQDKKIHLTWIRRRWHDSLLATKPFFQSLIYSFCEKNKLDPNQFEVVVSEKEFDTKEQGVFYQGKLRIHFYDLFSYHRVRGAIARTSFAEIVFEEAIPIDQEFLAREQHDFRDLVKSLKGRKDEEGHQIPTKITFLANPYIWSAWFLDVFKNLFELKKTAEKKAEENDNSGVLEIVKDEKGTEWLLYLNLIEGEEDLHYASLEEKKNPSLVNWDNYMFSLYNRSRNLKRYQIIYAVQDFYFCELGERKKHKKYFFLHWSKNKKEIEDNFKTICFSFFDKAKTKSKHCVVREKKQLTKRWINLLKKDSLFFADFHSRDWFLEVCK